jgi:hypothetical protein
LYQKLELQAPPSLSLPHKGGGNRMVQTGDMGNRIDRRHG